MKSHLLIAALAAIATVYVCSIEYPSRDFLVGRPPFVDTVTITQYINLRRLVVTTSNVHDAKIVCFDVWIYPATLFQTCHNIKR